ncbi:MAG: polysaccharide biosynthesis tyrosine autokinase [Blastochloris sp.]|nr:polysaccharide biosynthesis tyrosine autokinase [Blastochloris sp.]
MNPQPAFIPLPQPAIMASWSAAFFTKLHRYKALIKRRWWILAICVGLGFLYQSVKIFQAAPVYVSSSRMMVPPRMSTLAQDKAAYSEETFNFFGTQTTLMESGEVARRAAERVKATKPELTPSPVSVRAYQNPKTSIFGLTAEGSDPLYTQAFLDATMESFIRFKDDMKDQTSDKTLSSIWEQLDKLQKELKQQEDALFNFQKNNDVIFLREQSNTAGEYLVNLEKELAEKRKEFQLLDTILKGSSREPTSLNSGQTDTLDAAGELFKDGPEADYQKAKKDLDFDKNQLAELSLALKPQHPKLGRLREDISRKERMLDILRTQGLGRLKARRDSLALDMANTERQIAVWQVKALEANKRTVEYDQLKAARDLSQTTYSQLLSTVQSINVASNLSQNTISVLEYASPAYSRKKGVWSSLILGLGMGMAAGIGLLFLLDRIDDRVNSFTELREHFEEQVLGQIPLEPVSGTDRVPVLNQNDDRQIYAEAFRNIRSSLMYMPIETGRERPKTLLVTSAIPNEGKSTVACNLAATLAFSGSKVLLIDADLRKGLIHADLGTPSSPGLSEVLSQQQPWASVVHQTSVENLSFIPRGKTLSHVGELILSPAADLLIKETRNAFDFVVYDSPPIMATDDTPSLAPKVDGVLMVMRASHTSSRLTHNSLDILYQRQVHVLGLVFNCIDTNLPDYYHYAYYKYYYTPTDK